MTQVDFVPFAEMVDFLEQVCQRGESGTLFLGTKSCQSAQLAIRQGTIFLASYQGKRGMEALRLLAGLQECRFRFQQGILAPTADDLPDARTILTLLRGGRSVGPPPARDNAVDVIVPGLEQQKIVEECLAEYVGPVAGCIVEEHFQQGRELSIIIKLLAAEIPTIQEAREFAGKVRSRLAK